jgi:hypothetical protein
MAVICQLLEASLLLSVILGLDGANTGATRG